MILPFFHHPELGPANPDSTLPFHPKRVGGPLVGFQGESKKGPVVAEQYQAAYNEVRPDFVALRSLRPLGSGLLRVSAYLQSWSVAACVLVLPELSNLGCAMAPGAGASIKPQITERLLL